MSDFTLLCPLCATEVTASSAGPHQETLTCPACNGIISVPKKRPPNPVEVPSASLLLPAPGFMAALGWTLLVLLGPVFGGCYIGVAMRFTRNASDQLSARRFLIVALMMVFFALMVAVTGLNLRSQLRRALALRGPGKLHFFLVLLLVLPTLVLVSEIDIQVTHGLNVLFESRVQVSGVAGQACVGAYIPLSDNVIEDLARLPWPLALLCGGLLPGVAEEVFFRGFIGRGLVGRYGPLFGVFLTSLLFALAHIDPVQMSYTMVFGLVLHLVFLTTRSLLAPVMLHTLLNVLSISRLKLDLEETFILTGLPDESVHSLLLVLASLAAVLSICWGLLRTRVGWVLADGREWSPGYTTAEMPPTESAVPRQALCSSFALLAAIVFPVFFSVLFAATMTERVGLSGVLIRVR